MLYHAPQAAPAVGNLSWAIVLLGIHQVSTGVLQGMGRTYIPVINMTASAVAKVVLNWTLTAIPALGIVGAAWATVADIVSPPCSTCILSDATPAFSLDYPSLSKARLRPWSWAWPYTSSTPPLAVAARSNALADRGPIVARIGVYGAGMLLIGGLKTSDIKMVPIVGGYLVKILVVLRLLRTGG
jgi:stage V sporulation protein B